MLKFIYLVLAMAITPFAMEFINTKSSAIGNPALILKGIPAYVVNIIICAVVGLIITILPGGWGFSLWDFVILVFAIYFGNQFFFNVVIKPIVAYRKGT